MPISYRAAQNLIKREDEAGLRSALEQHLDPNLSNQNGWSLLMLAAVQGTVPLGRLLVAHGAGMQAGNRHGETALSLAAGKGHLPFLHMLLEQGASTDCRPHGSPLASWLATASGLPEPELSAVQKALGL